jgi:hypothetical protein
MENKAHSMHRQVKAANLNKAASVGIVFDASNEVDLKHIKALVNGLSPSVTKVGIVGYLKGSKKDFSYIGDKNYTFISDEDFNFFMQSNSDELDRFIAWKPEILLILCQDYNYPIHYIAKLSNGGLKVGQSGIYNDSLDFILEMKDKSLPALTKEIVHYLGNLQTV